MKYQLARGFPPLSGDRASLQENPSCLANTMKLIIFPNDPRSSENPERNLVSILLMHIDSISGQRSRAVSSPETSLGAILKLSKRKVCEKSCGHHLF